jgi:hypothetical protein
MKKSLFLNYRLLKQFYTFTSTKGHSKLVRILVDFGKFYKTRFQRHSSTPPQFWLILPNSTCFSFYTTSNSGWYYEIWLILPKYISRLNSMTRFGLSKFSGIQLNFSAEFRWIDMISVKNRQYRMALKVTTKYISLHGIIPLIFLGIFTELVSRQEHEFIRCCNFFILQ